MRASCLSGASMLQQDGLHGVSGGLFPTIEAYVPAGTGGPVLSPGQKVTRNNAREAFAVFSRGGRPAGPASGKNTNQTSPTDEFSDLLKGIEHVKLSQTLGGSMPTATCLCYSSTVYSLSQYG